MRTMKDIKQELLMKERRVSYWEVFGVVPSTDELRRMDKTQEVKS